MSLREIEKKQKELEREKFNLEMERWFSRCVESADSEAEGIKEFLDSREGVNFDRILWFIQQKEEDFPRETSDLQSIRDLYKTNANRRLSYIDADTYVKKLEPMGYQIEIEKSGHLECPSCGKKEDNLMLTLLRVWERGYGGRTYYLTRYIRPPTLFEYALLADKEALDRHLSEVKINWDNIESVLNELEALKNGIGGDLSVKGHSRRWICPSCFMKPNYKRIASKLRIEEPIRPSWLRVTKLESDKGE